MVPPGDAARSRPLPPGVDMLGTAGVVTVLAAMTGYGFYRSLSDLQDPTWPLVPLNPWALLGVCWTLWFLVLALAGVAAMLERLPERLEVPVQVALLALNPVLWGGACLGLWGAQARAIDAEFATLAPLAAHVVDTEITRTTTSVRTGGGANEQRVTEHFLLVLEYTLDGRSQWGRHEVDHETFQRYPAAALPRPFPDPILVRPSAPTKVRVVAHGVRPTRVTPALALVGGPALVLVGAWLLIRFLRRQGSRLAR